jgi:hypothetical protein
VAAGEQKIYKQKRFTTRNSSSENQPDNLLTALKFKHFEFISTDIRVYSGQKNVPL